MELGKEDRRMKGRCIVGNMEVSSVRKAGITFFEPISDYVQLFIKWIFISLLVFD